jgi:hypothetical protein
MTANLARKYLRSQDTLVSLSAPTLKAEPRILPVRPPVKPGIFVIAPGIRLIRGCA